MMIQFRPPCGYTALKNVADVWQKDGRSTKTDTYSIPFTTTKTIAIECVDVTDSYAGELGQVCDKGAKKTFTDSRTVSSPATGTYYIENTASANGKSATATVKIDVKVCDGGCTHTQGYWKNHPEAWPVSSLKLGTVSYISAQLLSIFNEPVEGNSLISLAYQLIAAKLDIANGADPSATSSLTTTLTDYNEGNIGPGHCESCLLKASFQ